jgi:citrate synthase
MKDKRATFWRTSISKVEKNKIIVRGYRIQDLIENLSFAGMIYLLFMGRLPRREEERLMNALLVAGCEHNITCPSAAAARLVITGGVGLPNAIASGINAFGKFHGGSIEHLMKLLYNSLSDTWDDVDSVAKRIVDEYLKKHMRIPGFGHFLHTDDPRVKKLTEIAEELGYDGKYLRLVHAIQEELSKAMERRMPINIDGIMGALLCELGFDWRAGKAIFTLSRSAGIAAHAYEEMVHGKPFKVTPLDEIEYIGPEERDLPT